jgi:hypothetical protein
MQFNFSCLDVIDYQMQACVAQLWEEADTDDLNLRRVDACYSCLHQVCNIVHQICQDTCAPLLYRLLPIFKLGKKKI